MKNNLLLKCQELNYAFNKASLNVQKDPSTLNENLVMIKDSFFEVVMFYDAYRASLKPFEKQYRRLDIAWNDFVNCLKANHEVELNDEVRQTLAEKLQNVKDENCKLIEQLTM